MILFNFGSGSAAQIDACVLVARGKSHKARVPRRRALLKSDEGEV